MRHAATPLPPFRPKAPEDVLDLPFSFHGRLRPEETIVAANVGALPAGLTIGAIVRHPHAPRCWVSGGAAGTRYVLSIAAATSSGRTLLATAVLLVGQPGLDDPLYLQPLPSELLPVPGFWAPVISTIVLAATQQGLALAMGCPATAVLTVTPLADDPAPWLQVDFTAGVLPVPPAPTPQPPLAIPPDRWLLAIAAGVPGYVVGPGYGGAPSEAVAPPPLSVDEAQWALAIAAGIPGLLIGPGYVVAAPEAVSAPSTSPNWVLALAAGIPGFVVGSSSDEHHHHHHR